MLYTFYNAFHNRQVTVSLPETFVGKDDNQRDVYQNIEFAGAVMGSPVYARKLRRIRSALCPSRKQGCLCGVVHTERND